MKNWNFQGYIAVPLELYGKTYIGDTCITADEITCGQFVDAMYAILTIKLGSLDNLPDFVSLCNNYADKPASDIPQDTVIEIFEEFKRLINQN